MPTMMGAWMRNTAPRKKMNNRDNKYLIGYIDGITGRALPHNMSIDYQDGWWDGHGDYEEISDFRNRVSMAYDARRMLYQNHG